MQTAREEPSLGAQHDHVEVLRTTLACEIRCSRRVPAQAQKTDELANWQLT
jgi:hypothetical protein